MASGLQITDQSRDITNRCHLTRGITGPNLNLIPCLKLDVYAQRANLCFSKTLEKTANFLLSEIGIGPVHRSILCVSAWICSSDALPLLVELTQMLLLQC